MVMFIRVLSVADPLVIRVLERQAVALERIASALEHVTAPPEVAAVRWIVGTPQEESDA